MTEPCKHFPPEFAHECPKCRPAVTEPRTMAEETLAMLERIRPITDTPHGMLSSLGPLLAHAAACVTRCAEMDAEPVSGETVVWTQNELAAREGAKQALAFYEANSYLDPGHAYDLVMAYRQLAAARGVTEAELRQMAMGYIRRWAVLHENTALAQIESFPELQREQMIAETVDCLTAALAARPAQ